MNKKICKVCQKKKEVSEFHKMKNGLFGVRNICKECRKQERIDYRLKPEVKLLSQKYYQDNKDSFRKRMNKHYHTLNGQYHQYKKRAKKSNIVFELTQIQCEKFFNTICEYCGDNIKGLGIDRIDNTQGYILSNCRPCCSGCNFMKHVLNEEQFKQKLTKVYNYFINR